MKAGIVQQGRVRWVGLPRLLVAAITMTCELFWNPSISDSIWFRVWSRSSFPWAPPLVRPTASISSMKMIAGAKLRACRSIQVRIRR